MKTDEEFNKKCIDVLSRRLSYLEERILLRNNSFDRAESSCLKHCLWLLHKELGDKTVNSEEKEKSRETNRDTDNRDTKPASKYILRKNSESR